MIAAVAATLPGSALGAAAEPSGAKSAKSRLPASAATHRFEIRGMHCDGCARGIQSELKLLPGVLGAEVSYSRRQAVVVLDTNRVDTARVVQAVKEAGYEAIPAPAPGKNRRR